MATKKITLNELRILVEKIVKEEMSLLNEEVYSDLFQFLDQGQRSMTQGTAYYVSSMNNSMNKNIADEETGEKIPNPMYDKLFKHTRFYFKWKDTFDKAMTRKFGEYEAGNRSGEYQKVEGYDVLESGKSGLYLPIIPTGSEYDFVKVEDGQNILISKEDARKYLRPSSPKSFSDTPAFRPLIVNNIYKLTGGGNIWVNKDFKGEYLGPQSPGDERIDEYSHPGVGFSEGLEDLKDGMYEITFEDVFDFSTAKKKVRLNNDQYEKAIEKKNNRDIVVDKFDPKTQTHIQMIIKDISPIS